VEALNTVEYAPPPISFIILYFSISLDYYFYEIVIIVEILIN